MLLRPGMSKVEVQSFFEGFRTLIETNELTIVAGETKLYGSNRASSSVIMFGPKPGWLDLMESCTVYFDTNNIIIAHKSMLID